MEIYNYSAAKTLAVENVSVNWLAADIAPTSGPCQGRVAEIAIIKAVGPLYVEFSGIAATTGGFPLDTGDIIQVEGYENIKNMRLIRNTNNTTAVAVFGYR